MVIARRDPGGMVTLPARPRIHPSHGTLVPGLTGKVSTGPGTFE